MIVVDQITGKEINANIPIVLILIPSFASQKLSVLPLIIMAKPLIRPIIQAIKNIFFVIILDFPDVMASEYLRLCSDSQQIIGCEMVFIDKIVRVE